MSVDSQAVDRHCEGMPLQDRLIRWASAACVVLVASIAGVISYRHAVELALRVSESSLTAHLFPLAVDGLAVSASMTLLWAARYSLTPPRLARCSMWLGIAATLAVNTLHGLTHGVLAAVIAGWPAVALVLSFELSTWIVAASRSLDARQLVVIEQVEPEKADKLRSVVELMGTEPAISGAELARRLTIPYQLALDLRKQAKALMR